MKNGALTTPSYGPDWSRSFPASLPLANRRRLMEMAQADALDETRWFERLQAWRYQARPAQIAPPGHWRCWLYMGGRGAGKTRAGAEWLREQMMVYGKERAALVAPTLLDAREVMIEGVSGLRAIGPEHERPVYVSTRRRLEWPNGAVAQVFSAEDPDSLRGPQFDVAWCDEIAAWSHGADAWDMLMLGLRLGDDPRVVATTTPRPVPLVRRLLDEDGVVLTRSATQDNAANLSGVFISTVERLYGGQLIGRRELEGMMIEDVSTSMWTLSKLDEMRLNRPPDDLVRVILALDPPAGMGEGADACGVVVAGVRANSEGVVLDDGTTQGLAPIDWAGSAVALARQWGVAEIVVETNQGGSMIRQILVMAGWKGAVREVHARWNKAVRAAPISALYGDNRVRHVGVFRELEDEMLAFGTSAQQGSPDRVDALVWALTVLLLDEREGPRVRWI